MTWLWLAFAFWVLGTAILFAAIAAELDTPQYRAVSHAPGELIPSLN